MTRPDGQSYSEVIWLKSGHKKRLRESLSTLEQKYSPEELKSLFVLMGDLIMSKGKHTREEEIK